MIKFNYPKCGTQFDADNDFCGKNFTIPKNLETERPSPTAESVDSVDCNQGPSVWITCPHCWKRFDFKEVNYISRHLDLLGDPLLGLDAQKRFLPVKFSANGMAIDEKGMECSDMACPNCHLKIPESVVNLPTSIFSIVGAPSSGKSYYLATMLWQVRKTLPHYFEFNLGDVDSSFNAVINEYESILFMNNYPDQIVSLPKTELQGSGYTNQVLLNGFSVDLPKPFIFALTPMPGNIRYQKERKDLERNIILYDNAGEHFQPGHESVNNLATNHLAFSDGIIFVFDPMREPRMQDFCLRTDPQFQQESTNQLALFYEMASRIRKFSGLQVNDKYTQPLIVAIAKFDVLRKKFNILIEEEDYMSYDDKKFEYSLNLQKITNISFLLRKKLIEIAPEFVGAVEDFSETVYFVPVSAFGCSPKVVEHTESENVEANRNKRLLGIIPNEMKPFWTEVPFLLHLYLHGFLPGISPDPEGTEEIKNYKFVNETIVFSFPNEKCRYELPYIYWGTSLYSTKNKKYYKLPIPDNFHQKASCRASSLDEQIDINFWNNLKVE